jgi:hypothetical protein
VPAEKRLVRVTARRARPGNAAGVIDSILKAQAERKEQAGYGGVVLSFSKQTVLPQLVSLIEAFQVPEEVRCESENPVPSPGR